MSLIHKGVRVYDVIEQKIISLIKMEPPRVRVGGEQEEEDVPARISWSDQFHLFVAMGDRVRVCEVKTRSAADLASPRGRDLPQHMVEITASFQVGEGQISTGLIKEAGYRLRDPTCTGEFTQPRLFLFVHPFA